MMRATACTHLSWHKPGTCPAPSSAASSQTTAAPGGPWGIGNPERNPELPAAHWQDRRNRDCAEGGCELPQRDRGQGRTVVQCLGGLQGALLHRDAAEPGRFLSAAARISRLHQTTFALAKTIFFFPSEGGERQSLTVSKLRLDARAQSIAWSPCRTSLPAVSNH